MLACLGVFENRITMLLAWLLLAQSVPLAAGGSFLIVSSMSGSKVGYVFMPDWGLNEKKDPQILIDSGLNSPQGIAVDQRRQQLLVCDPDLAKIFSYGLKIDGEKLRTDGVQGVAANNVKARMVAVDGVGNIFFTNEENNQIVKVSAENNLKGSSTQEVVYDAAAGIQWVSGPSGVAVDNFHVFWANKVMGVSKGSVTRAAEKPGSPSSPESVAVLQNNANTVYGVCLTPSNVYYCDETKHVFGVKKSGGEEVTMTDKLEEPRGCAWDGDGTVFVADKKANSVFSFSGNMRDMAPVKLFKVANFDGAFGVAVLSKAARLPAVMLSVVLAVYISLRSIS